MNVDIGEVVTLCVAEHLEYYLILKATFEEEHKENILRQCLICLRKNCQIDNVKHVFFSLKDKKLLYNSELIKEIFEDVEINVYLQIK